MQGYDAILAELRLSPGAIMRMWRIGTRIRQYAIDEGAGPGDNYRRDATEIAQQAQRIEAQRGLEQYINISQDNRARRRLPERANDDMLYLGRAAFRNYMQESLAEQQTK